MLLTPLVVHLFGHTDRLGRHANASTLAQSHLEFSRSCNDLLRLALFTCLSAPALGSPQKLQSENTFSEAVHPVGLRLGPIDAQFFQFIPIYTL